MKLDTFHSPDTVCKYCNVDFKYFRSLKNHLRTHESSLHKPYKCRHCQMGFCTNMNALRHIQKVHSDVSPNQMENCVKLEIYPSEDDNDSLCSDDGIPLYTEGSSPLLPPTAHSSHRVSPNGHISPLSHISPAQSPHLRKEQEDRANTPLDFSMRQYDQGHRHGVKSGKTEETAMDLSVRKFGNQIPIAPKVKKDLFVHSCLRTSLFQTA